MKTCPIGDCDTLIRTAITMCYEDWMRLSHPTRNEIGYLYATARGSEWYQRAVEAAVAELNESAVREAVAG